MAEVLDERGAGVIKAADDLGARGDFRAAVDLLTAANRRAPSADVERALVRLRRAGGRAALERAVPAPAPRTSAPASNSGALFEVDASELSAQVVREGIDRCGYVLVRRLVPPDRVARLAAGIDSAIAGYDAAKEGQPHDPAWYDPREMPDRIGSDMPEALHRAILRGRGALWTADSPRMLFELFDFFDEAGLGQLMTDYFGARPLLSGLKGTLRRVPPDVDTDGRWHQDGSFLGHDVQALNIWITLTACGRDAPGLDIVPRRFDEVVCRDDGARYDWALSDDAVVAAAGGTPIVRPELEAGDAVLFDQLLLHRTGTSPGMTQVRHAIESWFFSPSAYPLDHVAILY